MTQVQSPLPDFDTLKDMAENHPEALEELRVTLTEELFAGLPEDRRRRLQGTQFLIDMTRRRAKNPMQCCIKLSQLMWERVAELQDVMAGSPYGSMAGLQPQDNGSVSGGAADSPKSKVVKLVPKHKANARSSV